MSRWTNGQLQCDFVFWYSSVPLGKFLDSNASNYVPSASVPSYSNHSNIRSYKQSQLLITSLNKQHINITVRPLKAGGILIRDYEVPNHGLVRKLQNGVTSRYPLGKSLSPAEA
jgi:hypothetical protein